jgi:alpha-glucuronidase
MLAPPARWMLRVLPAFVASALSLALASACSSSEGSASGDSSGGMSPAPAGGNGGGPTPAGARGGTLGAGGSATAGGNAPVGGGSATTGGTGAGAASGVGGNVNPPNDTGGAGGTSVSGGGGGAGAVTGGSSTTETYPKPDALADETGAQLWLRYPAVPIPGRRAEYVAAFKQVVKSGSGATTDAAAAELIQGLSGLTGTAVAAGMTAGAGSVVVGTGAAAPIQGLPLASRLAALGPEGYLVEPAEIEGAAVIVVAGNTELGALYGSFALLRHLQMHRSLAELPLTGSPRIRNRILNHWDNLDRTVERGYAGRSIWDWTTLPAVSARYTDYARANASIGINGAVLTNVNANAQVLSPSYLSKVKAVAEVFRPFGIKVYLTARFSAPIEIGGQSTADPNAAAVRQWWTTKVDEIYQQIPDFGGFLVKANSEGQPGPQDYNRTHAEGANMLAQALAPHGGIVMWRAFVYSEDSPTDRIKQAYEEFEPLDGQFDENVLVQAKNGPLDFQPREPFHPLFGAMPETPIALELQVTKEYLGEDTHLAYLGPLFEEVLKADTGHGAGATVAKVIDGSFHDHALSAIAGVANVGDDTNWTGSHMNQANWYVFGRMAWDPELGAAAIADEWVRATFSNDPLVVGPVVELLMRSREALVNYMTPLGLVHIMGTDHHYGPAPWVSNLSRAEWNPVYYHKADATGLGFNRTSAGGGSNAVAQYAATVRDRFADRAQVPENLLLFFHHVGWQDPLSTGRTLWAELVHRYSLGVDDVGRLREQWATVDGYIDAARFKAVSDFLQIQHYEARWWRDACLTYFATFSKQPIPEGYAMPANPLSYYQGLTCPSDPKKPRCSQVYTGNPSPAIEP